MKPGERVIICTPGGGGYGDPDEDEKNGERLKKTHARDQWRGTGSISNYQAVQESA